MQRPIKFRVWEKLEKIMYFFSLNEKNLNVAWLADNCEVMQFTGLLDKNGKEIYEGDIVQHFYKGHKVIAPFIWHSNRAQFGLDAKVDFMEEEGIEEDTEGYGHLEIETVQHGLPEIIGNVFENPDLLV